MAGNTRELMVNIDDVYHHCVLCAWIKSHNETHYFLQLTYANKTFSMGVVCY